MDSELLLKFIGYFPDYLSLTLLCFFWTTLVEIAVYGLLVKREGKMAGCRRSSILRKERTRPISNRLNQTSFNK